MSWRFVFLSNVFFLLRSLFMWPFAIVLILFVIIFENVYLFYWFFMHFRLTAHFKTVAQPMCVGWAIGFVFFMDFLLSFHLMEKIEFQVVDDMKNTNSESVQRWTANTVEQRIRWNSFEQVDDRIHLMCEKIICSGSLMELLMNSNDIKGTSLIFDTENIELSCDLITYQENRMVFRSQWQPRQLNVTNVIQGAAWLAPLSVELDSM